jgi:hypothetical protein
MNRILFFILALTSCNFQPNSSSYRPQFKESPFELVMGTGFKKAHLYYKTDEKIPIGSQLPHIEMIQVSQNFNKDNPNAAVPSSNKFDIHYLDNTVNSLLINELSLLF